VWISHITLALSVDQWRAISSPIVDYHQAYLSIGSVWKIRVRIHVIPDSGDRQGNDLEICPGVGIPNRSAILSRVSHGRESCRRGFRVSLTNVEKVGLVVLDRGAGCRVLIAQWDGC